MSFYILFFQSKTLGIRHTGGYPGQVPPPGGYPGQVPRNLGLGTPPGGVPVEIDGVSTNKSGLSHPFYCIPSCYIPSCYANINFQDPNGNNILLSTTTTNAFRHRHFFQVHLTQPMKHVDIPGFLTALKPAWQTLRPGTINISLFFDEWTVFNFQYISFSRVNGESLNFIFWLQPTTILN